MKKVEVKPGGILAPSEKAYFGGPFSIMEKLRMGGVGSPKMIYEGGIPEFDEEDRGIDGEIGYVSMEVLKNGLILRLNRNNRHRCVGIRLTDISNIQLTAYRVQALLSRKEKGQSKIVHRGELVISSTSGATFPFQIRVVDFKLLLAFFQKPPFGHLFEYEVSETAAEVEDLKDWKKLLG